MKTLFTKFIIAVGFSVPLFYIAMGPMISKPWSWSVPKYYRPNDKSIKLCTYTNDVLKIPVMIAGYKFYINGFKITYK